MARDHKQRQTRVSHKQMPVRNPELCRICGQLVFRIERDHPFRRENDPEFTIAVCSRCHIKVTKWDDILDRHIDSNAQVAAPFLYILHRIQLAFTTRGIESQTLHLRNMENVIVHATGRSSFVSGRHIRKRRNLLSDADRLALLTDIAAWAKRASELTLERLRDDVKLQFRPDFDVLVSVTEDIAADPRQFYELLLAYLASPNRQGLSDRTNSLISAIRSSAPMVDIYDLWHDLASVIERLSERVGK
jgi:hypothetical protein